MTVLATLTQAERMLAEARTAQEVEEVVRSAEAARVLAQQLRLGTEAINHATAIKLKAEIRLAQVVDAGQAAGEIATAGGDRSIARTTGNGENLADIGIDSQRLAEARVLARSLDEGVVDQIVDVANEEGTVVSRNGVIHAAQEMAVANLANEDGIDIALHKRPHSERTLEEWRVTKAEAAVLTLASFPDTLIEAVADAIESPEIADRAADITRQIAAARRGR